MTEARALTVRFGFGELVGSESDYKLCQIVVHSDGSDTIYEVKQKIAAAVGGNFNAEDLMIFFNTNTTKMGKQFQNDPRVNEHDVHLSQFNILEWLERFPHWHLSAKLLPPTPPPPGESVHRAAALSEQKHPDQAVQDAINRGDIPKASELPVPWGPKPYTPNAQDAFIPKYPKGFSPLVDADG